MDSKMGLCDFILFVSVLLVTTNGIEACFNTNHIMLEHMIKTDTPFYQECRCTEPGHKVKSIKWLDNNNHEIKALGSGTRPNMYTEKRGNSVSLHISSMSNTLSGAYKCVIDHGGPISQQEYTLIGYDPVYFYNTKSNQHIIKGGNAVISCEARGKSPPLISWHKGQEELIAISEGEKYEIVPEGLKITNVTDEDEGTYICTATVFETSEDVDSVIKVEVVTIPEIKDIKATPDFSVRVGEALTIECLAEGVPNVEYTWKKITKDTEEISNITWVQNFNALSFEAVEEDDRGTYECTALNKAGEVKKAIDIDVLVPPSITMFENVTAIEGSATQIVCIASGRPRPKVQIVYEAEDNEDNPSITADKAYVNDTETKVTLTFLNVNRTRQGYYYCNVANGVDQANDTMYLTVAHKPYFDNYVEHIWGWNGRTINLNCETDSNPPANTIWRYQGNTQTNTDTISAEDQTEITKILNQRLITTSDDKVSFKITNQGFYGAYDCTAINAMGQATKLFFLTEASRPDVVSKVTVTNITATSVTLGIEGPEYVKGPPVHGYTSEYDEAEMYNVTNIHRNRTWSIDRPFLIRKLRPNTTYFIKVAAMNEIGVGSWSETLEFTTPEKSKPEPPMWEEASSLIMQSGEDQIIRWKAPEHNGDPIDYYVIRYCPTHEGEVKHELCKELRIPPSTMTKLKDLEYNTTYYLQLLAHNTQGNSSTIDTYITLPEIVPELPTAEPMLSGGAIIGVSIVVVFICLLLLDLLFLCWRRQGMIANCVTKKRKRTESESHTSRDRKGLLKDNGESLPSDTLKRPDQKPKEYEYNKTTGVITGKHSAV